MQRIRTKIPSLTIGESPRAEAIQFGKWIYFTLLAMFFCTFIHAFFSSFYLLKGEGFVFSDNQTITLEFDAMVSRLFVKEGDTVSIDAPLFEFGAFEVQHALTELSIQLSQLQKDQLQNEIALNEKKALYESTKQYLQFTSHLQQALQTLEKRRLVGKVEMSEEMRRHFEATQKLHQYASDMAQLAIGNSQLKTQLEETRQQFTTLEAAFSNGRVRAPVSGIISQIHFTPGTMLKKGQTALQIFYGKPYLYTYFDETSWVSYQIGDKVLVKLPDHRGYRVGTIIKRLPIASPLPAEFQPKFKPALRNQLAVIELPLEAISDTPLLSTAQIRKPLGFGLLTRLSTIFST